MILSIGLSLGLLAIVTISFALIDFKDSNPRQSKVMNYLCI